MYINKAYPRGRHYLYVLGTKTWSLPVDATGQDLGSLLGPSRGQLPSESPGAVNAECPRLSTWRATAAKRHCI